MNGRLGLCSFKIPVYLTENTALPVACAQCRVLCVRASQSILIHLLPNSLSKMNTFQKPVVRLTLCTPLCLNALLLVPKAHSDSSGPLSPHCFHTEPGSQRHHTLKHLTHDGFLELPRPCIHRTKGQIAQLPPRSISKKGQHKPLCTGHTQLKASGSWKCCCSPAALVCLGQHRKTLVGSVFLSKGHAVPPYSACEAPFRRETCPGPAGSPACGSHSRAYVNNPEKAVLWK